jgi:hypothetical protein
MDLYSPEDVSRKVRQIVEEGSVIYTDHCRQRMLDRCVTMQDIEYLLESGVVSEKAEWSAVFQHWKYTIEGTDIDGEELEAVFVIVEEELMDHYRHGFLKSYELRQVRQAGKDGN